VETKQQSSKAAKQQSSVAALPLYCFAMLLPQIL